jgi:hypothetical protein
MTDDPEFYAWLDGELAEPQASAMAAKVAADPALSAFAAEHRALGARLSNSFAPIVDAPVPERLQQAARPSADVLDFAAARERRRPLSWSVRGFALAASLALGLTIGALLPRDGGGPFRAEGGQLVASGALGTALDRQLASAGAEGGVRIGLSFRDRDGRYCRTFTATNQTGLACRGDDAWQIEGLIGASKEQGDYRQASGFDPALGDLVDRRIAGEPLDPAQEAAARQKGWR